MQTWVAAAFASAFFAGMVSILAKCGIKTTDSDVATALRTCVVLVFTWVMVAVVGSVGAALHGAGFSMLSDFMDEVYSGGAEYWRCCVCCASCSCGP